MDFSDFALAALRQLKGEKLHGWLHERWCQTFQQRTRRMLDCHINARFRQFSAVFQVWWHWRSSLRQWIRGTQPSPGFQLNLRGQETYGHPRPWQIKRHWLGWSQSFSSEPNDTRDDCISFWARRRHLIMEFQTRYLAGRRSNRRKH